MNTRPKSVAEKSRTQPFIEGQNWVSCPYVQSSGSESDIASFQSLAELFRDTWSRNRCCLRGHRTRTLKQRRSGFVPSGTSTSYKHYFRGRQLDYCGKEDRSRGYRAPVDLLVWSPYRADNSWRSRNPACT